jgi:hypothetical protein
MAQMVDRSPRMRKKLLDVTEPRPELEEKNNDSKKALKLGPNRVQVQMPLQELVVTSSKPT